MEGRHPKRRKDKYNPYSIFEIYGHYYVSFKDGQGIQHQFEINESLYRAFNEFELDDLSYLNVWDRHIEQSEVWEPTLYQRAFQKTDALEDIVFRKLQEEAVHKAIRRLPDKQKRRLLLYYFGDMTYEQIAKKEQCSFQAVANSIAAAEKNLKKFLE